MTIYMKGIENIMRKYKTKMEVENMKRKVSIALDMDGTMYDLYSVTDVYNRLDRLDHRVYHEGGTLVDMKKLNELVERLMEKGHEVMIISWLGMRNNPTTGELRGSEKELREFDEWTIKTKDMWLDEYLPAVKIRHYIPYGAPKHEIPDEIGLLIDDDLKRVAPYWIEAGGIHSDPAKEDMLKVLQRLL